MARDTAWVSYGGTARIGLALVLLAVAGGLVLTGARLPLTGRVARPGRVAVVFMILIWFLALTSFLICLLVYVQQAHEEHLYGAPPADPIAPVTFVAALAIFVTIIATSEYGFGVRLVSAVVGAMAAPMIFELPFDLLVMARTYPPVPPHPALYRALFFVPFFVLQISTLWLLTLSPRMRLSRPAFYFLAGMFFVFAIWSLFGMAYPSAPIPIALNMVSKILAFAATLCLFLPLRQPAGTPVASQADDAGRRVNLGGLAAPAGPSGDVTTL